MMKMDRLTKKLETLLPVLMSFEEFEAAEKARKKVKVPAPVPVPA